MGVHIGVARTTAEQEAVYRLRYEVYVEEMGYAYPAADHRARLLPDEGPRPSDVLYAIADDAVVGTLTLTYGAARALTDQEQRDYDLGHFLPVVPMERMAILSRVMIRHGYRAGPVAPALLTRMIRDARERRVSVLFCRCRPHLLGFYERLGFRAYGEVMTTPVAGLLIPLMLVLDDVPYCDSIQSPLLPVMRSYPWDRTRARRITALLPRVPPVRSIGAADEEMEALLRPVVERGGDPPGPFDGLELHDVAHLLAGSHIITCRAGDRVITERHADRALYMVLDGTLEVRHDRRPVAVIPPGGVCGEMALLRHGRRTADVVAISDHVTLLCLGERHLTSGGTHEPGVVSRLRHNLSRIAAQRYNRPMGASQMLA